MAIEARSRLRDGMTPLRASCERSSPPGAPKFVAPRSVDLQSGLTESRRLAENWQHQEPLREVRTSVPKWGRTICRFSRSHQTAQSDILYRIRNIHGSSHNAAILLSPRLTLAMRHCLGWFLLFWGSPVKVVRASD